MSQPSKVEVKEEFEEEEEFKEEEESQTEDEDVDEGKPHPSSSSKLLSEEEKRRLYYAAESQVAKQLGLKWKERGPQGVQTRVALKGGNRRTGVRGPKGIPTAEESGEDGIRPSSKQSRQENLKRKL